MKLKRKSFKITCSLKEGYQPNGKLHRIQLVYRVINEWMAGRLKNHQPVLNGLVQEGMLFFPAKEKVAELVTASPTAVFTGELSSPEDLRRKDKEVKETLESLAVTLKKRLKQESVFIVYQDMNWCV